MKGLLFKIVIGIYCLLVSAKNNKRIFFPGESRHIEHGIDPRIKVPSNDGGGVVESPKFGQDWICGYENGFGLLHSGYLSQEERDTRSRPLYYLNETAENLSAAGFNIEINEVGFGDVLCNFTFSNETFEKTFAYDYIGSVLPTGGEPAKVARAYYMAQIGEKKDDNITWLCDGVLINNRWILSAAHCFTEQGVDPNVVRVGDLDKEDFKDPPLDRNHEFIRDYPIEQLVPYPDFNVNERYHDIVLIQMPRPIPLHSSTIFPICLPWDTETNKDLVGIDVTLTGWGATQYRGPKTPRLQEVNLTVFETSVCSEAYSEVPENRRKYPQGITEDGVLCVGWKEDGKDACGGDSGAPIVYLKDDSGNPNLKEILIESGKMCGTNKRSTRFGLDAQKRRFVLAGIVSGGFGCGLKEFPGLYIPINKPNYLQWIKEVAFKDYV